MRILIADDSLVMRRLLRSNLEKWDYEVVEAENGAAAWELFQSSDVPLVLSDWSTPACRPCLQFAARPRRGNYRPPAHQAAEYRS